jgi:hypothetical protein
MIAKAAMLFASVWAVTTLERVTGTLGLVAGIVIALTVIGGGLLRVWRVVKGLDEVIENTRALPKFMEDQRRTNEEVQQRLEHENAKVADRLDAGAKRMDRIEEMLSGIGPSRSRQRG